MSNINLIIEERPRNIGNFMVERLLPFRGKKKVGPFIFIDHDHMGPANMNDHQNMDVPPHPHIGLSRFIYRNFVATSQELIDKAKGNWLAQTFKPLPGETDFVPLSEENPNLKRK